ncbi:hypothetical protein RRG08_041267 [Elysia crispata]|uniref:Uncharacterized protein n=1 Tax=Elysia crispata TaxID=231223 RepID=A0AAE1DBR6_9GAST|nr:hypothetical protein RRG08_041267 [Elysia crispata]
MSSHSSAWVPPTRKSMIIHRAVFEAKSLRAAFGWNNPLFQAQSAQIRIRKLWTVDSSKFAVQRTSQARLSRSRAWNGTQTEPPTGVSSRCSIGQRKHSSDGHTVHRQTHCMENSGQPDSCDGFTSPPSWT